VDPRYSPGGSLKLVIVFCSACICEFRTAKSQQHERGSWPLSQKGNDLGFVAFGCFWHYFCNFWNGS
jgi:hypothetical protein